MRVMFCPSGVGLGHVGRCIPIARNLESENVKILLKEYNVFLFVYISEPAFLTL